jgi:hypothetical protein
VPVRQDKRPQELRLLAKAAKDGKVVQRVLGITLILDRTRAERSGFAGWSGSADFGPGGAALQCRWDCRVERPDEPGRPPKLTDEQSAELKRMILAGPADQDNGCPEYKVRHIVDLVKDKWGICISPETAHTAPCDEPCAIGLPSEAP